MNTEKNIIDENYPKVNITRVLLLLSGIILIATSIIYNEFLLTLFDKTPPLREVTISKIRTAQVYFFLTGIIFIFAAEVISRISWLEHVTRKELISNSFLVVLSIFIPLFVLEFTLRPFVQQQPTTIFLPDSELGWRLKPNTDDVWGGVKVKINNKGLRGPELSYSKQPDVKRILYLGDSVTFGYKLADYEQSFPYLIERILENKLGYNIETINSGVGGYSPWQEYKYLTTEGIKYDPDLIVVSFVLNDVTEKFGLARFGGTGEGHQLEHRATRTMDNLAKKSSIVYFARKISTQIRFGSEIQKGAEQKEDLDVRSLAHNPNRPDVLKAWDITLQNLGKIFDYATSNDIPVFVAVFPFTFQFENVDKLSTPQKIVTDYTSDKKVPVIDLLPILSMKLKEEGAKPEYFFVDMDHLSPVGNEIVAEILADFIQNKKLITDLKAK